MTTLINIFDTEVYCCEDVTQNLCGIGNQEFQSFMVKKNTNQFKDLKVCKTSRHMRLELNAELVFWWPSFTKKWRKDDQPVV